MNESGGGGVAGLIIMVIYLAILILMIAGCWKVYVKANKPGWACIIPIYNVIVWLEITGRPIWWIILLFIPFVSIVMVFIVCIDLAKSFGKGGGFGVGMAFLPFIFLPMLGFGSASYQGPSAKS